MSDPAPANSAKPAGGAEAVGQDDIDKLLEQAAAQNAAPAAPSSPANTKSIGQDDIDQLLAQAGNSGGTADAGSIDPNDAAAIDELLKQASFDDPSGGGAPAMPAIDTSAFELPNFQQAIADAQHSSIDLLRDVDLNVKIELGRSAMLVEDVLKLAEGSVVELDKLAGDPVDVFVNDRLVARGEVLVLNDNFCVRVNEIISAVRDGAE